MKLIIYTLLFLLSGSLAYAQDAREIVAKAENARYGESSKGHMTIKIVRPKWTREMSMKNWSLGDDYALTMVTAPAKEKGMAFLKRKKEVWNWVPSIQRLIKLPPSMMMQSWMGTDFTNDDLVNQSSMSEDYDHKILTEEEVDGHECWKIEMIPHEDAPVVWGKVIIWVTKEHYLGLKTEFYDEDMDLVSTLQGSDIKEMDGQMIPAQLEMIPADKEGHKTVMIQNSIEFDVELNESFFTPQNVKRLRP